MLISAQICIYAISIQEPSIILSQEIYYNMGKLIRPLKMIIVLQRQQYYAAYI